jgi:acid phosphatase
MRRQRAPEAQSLASAIMALLYALAKVLWPMFVVFAAARLYKHGPEYSLKSVISPVADHTSTSPHAASWRSWSHPSQMKLDPRSRTLKQDWNILHHLGGNGPWVEMLEKGGKTPDLTPPPGCEIDQVHMV